MKRSAYVLALAALAAALTTKRGRGIVGSALVSAGVAIIPEPEPDPERDARLRQAIDDAIAWANTNKSDTFRGMPL